MVTSSAVVGSSAISSAGSLASAMAIITRWRWPPESWCGNASSRCSASAKPAWFSTSMTRARNWLAGMRRCSVIASATCRPMRCSGLRLVIGSWNTMPASSPRARCNAAGAAPIICWPSSRMLPVGLVPPGGRSCSSDSAVTDLPEPDSPTSASVSPRSSVNETPSTTRLAPKRRTGWLTFDQAHGRSALARQRDALRVAHEATIGLDEIMPIAAEAYPTNLPLCDPG